METEKEEHVQVMRYDDPSYLNSLIQSITLGYTAVVINVNNSLDPELGSIQYRPISFIGTKAECATKNQIN